MFFDFFRNFSSQTNSRVLISNTEIVFFRFQTSKSQIRHFWSQIQTYFVFCKTWQIDRFEAVDFKYDNSFLKILPPKYPNKGFLVPYLDIFVLFKKFCHQTILSLLISSRAIVILNFQRKTTQVKQFWLQIYTFLFFFYKILLLGEFEGVDLKQENSFFKFYPRISQIRLFWPQIQKKQIFRKILKVEKFEAADFRFDKSFFRFQPRKKANKTFFVPNLDIFEFF